MLVVQAEEASLYTSYPIVILPEYIKDIRSTREWILHNAVIRDDKVVQLDDDLVFAIRRNDDPKRFKPALDIDIEYLFVEIEDFLDSYAHVGVSGREGGNRKTDSCLEVGRMMRILGYRMDILRKIGVGYTTEFMEDFHVTLQLLRMGYPNKIINWIVQNQNGSDLPGGCSEHRSLEKHCAAAEALHRFHPEFVKVVDKQTKTAWNGRKRKDVIVQWKKAYESANTYPDVGPPTSGEADNL